MLVLSRKVGEDVVIDHPTAGKITVRITRIEGNRVHVGVEAPREIPIRRKEVQDKIDQEAA